MSTAPKKARKKKDPVPVPVPVPEVIKEGPPSVVTKIFAESTFSGLIKEGKHGAEYLECVDAKYTWKTGITYEGPFVASCIEGSGKFLWPDGSSYQGQLHNGKRHGQGSYLGADGFTRFEGQWCAGLRDGNGRLTYNAEGTAFYDGCWKAGQKHGFGKQNWESGNVYEGEWLEGKMQGKGTMTWRISGVSEQYVGFWKDNQPHGAGTHTWHSCDITDPVAMHTLSNRPTPLNQQQQLNNRYEGQWALGKRNGHGTFYYANGAYYRGEWKDQMKHGRGRHIFEDGTVYEGPFEEDQMLQYTKPEPAEGTDIILRCTDLSDLHALALPADRNGFEPWGGVGYTDHSKIFREVYNMLLRHLGELRELYSRYRAMAPKYGADPFTLQAYQFWAFARDTGLLTPACPLPRFGRAVFSSPRHHAEVAPEDLEELQPLTPRPKPPRRGARARGPGSAASPVASAPASARAAEAEQTDSQSSEGSDAASSSLPSPVAEGRAAPGEALAAEEGRAAAGEATPSSEQALAAGSAQRAEAGEGQQRSRGEAALGPRFQRSEGSSKLLNLHSPTRPLLFRQFLEGIVRLAPVRFPHERGLESQIQRLFKERILAAVCEPPPASEQIFGFLSQKDFQETLQELTPTLWSLFKQPWGRISLEHDQQQHQPPTIRANTLHCAQHKLHVKARLDMTMRVKDALRLLDSCGLLRHVPANALLADPVVGEAHDAAKEGHASGSVTDPDLAFGGRAQRLGAPAHGTSVPNQSSGIGMLRGLLGRGGAAITKQPGPPEEEKLVLDKEGGKRRDGAVEVAPASPEDSPDERNELRQCDFTASSVEALRWMAEVLSPSCLRMIRWEVGWADAGPSNEQVSALDYAETELVFAEFLRLLVQVADHGTRRHVELCEKLSLAKRFDAFLREVFLPALTVPYKPPHVRAEAKAGKDETGAYGEGEADQEECDDEDGNSVDPKELPQPELWAGFDGRHPAPRAAAAVAAVVAAVVPRHWPASHEQEVGAW